MGARPAVRRSHVTIGVGVVVVVLIALVAGVYLYDRSQRDVIANGVKIDGIGVGGLHEAAARAKVQHALVAELDTPVKVHWGSHHWTLTGSQARVTVDTDRMVQEALSASREARSSRAPRAGCSEEASTATSRSRSTTPTRPCAASPPRFARR